ncbi:hypothetical protein GCM10028793_24490 [Nocardiopsis oceani]
MVLWLVVLWLVVLWLAGPTKARLALIRQSLPNSRQVSDRSQPDVNRRVEVTWVTRTLTQPGGNLTHSQPQTTESNDVFPGHDGFMSSEAANSPTPEASWPPGARTPEACPG